MTTFTNFFTKTMLVASLFFATLQVFGQTSLVKYEFTSRTPVTVAGLQATEISFNGGVIDNNATGKLAAKTWTLTSFDITNAEYLEFTLTADADLQSATLQQISAVYTRGNKTAPTNIRIVISKDNFSTYTTLYENLGIGTDDTSGIKPTKQDLLNTFTIAGGEIAKVRIYAWRGTETGVGAFNFTSLEFLGEASVPQKPAPTAHVTNFQATVGNPSYSTVTLTWTDVPDADFYLIKATSFLPVDGAIEGDSASLVKAGIAKGVQTYTFTNVTENTTFVYSIYPYNNTGAAVLYYTDGTVPAASATTTIEPNVVALNVADALSASGDNVWVKGYIIGFVQTQVNNIYLHPSAEVVESITDGAGMNFFLADDPNETDYTKAFLVKLSDQYIRRELNIKDHIENIGKLIQVKGKVGNVNVATIPYKGFPNSYSYRFLTESAGINPIQNTLDNITWTVDGRNIIVAGISEKSSIALYNLQGQTVYNSISKNEVTIPVQSAGSYILRVNSDTKSVAKKIVVKY